MDEKFREYVEKFDLNDEHILRKYYHSIRVKNLCSLIAKSENMSADDIVVAKVSGLLHDYGRFMQWRDYKTFNDNKSLDHGDLGVELLFYNNEIINIWPNVKDYDEIFDAIKYHNKLQVPEVLSEHNRKLCNIVRDADKLDIIYLNADRFISEEESDSMISPRVKEDFDSHTCVQYRHIESGNDHIIQALSLIFELNFEYSFKYLKEHNLINKMYEAIKDKNKFDYYFDEIDKYISKRLGDDKQCLKKNIAI